MKTGNHVHGLSLVEMLIVVAIIAILVTMVVSVASRVDNQAKEKGTESIFTLLDSALQEYHEFTGHYPEQAEVAPAKAVDHIEYLYGELDSVPSAQKILRQLSGSTVQDKYRALGTDETTQTPPEVYDPWGTPLDYRYVAGQNFPLLVSAGPDKTFGTPDDIDNK
ncbi:MAG: type II secretion system protein [Sedimentisphaerales bacterium]|jgi:prepilin-type N-terminal cleavage/methylation domain-containing protein